MNDIARLWRDHKALRVRPGAGVSELRIIRQAFIAGCEAMRDDINHPDSNRAEVVPANQLGLHLVGGKGRG